VDELDALDVAVEAFRARLVRVADAAWTRSTPCEDWDVRFLVAHVVGGHMFAADVLAGSSAEDAIATVMSSSVLGEDALGRHDEFAAANVEASGDQARWMRPWTTLLVRSWARSSWRCGSSM
jgi:hypothetical protein